MIELLMKCGHRLLVNPDKVPFPTCFCGEKVVARTVNAPAPNIRGHAMGPHVRQMHLGPIDVSAQMRPAPAPIVVPDSSKSVS